MNSRNRPARAAILLFAALLCARLFATPPAKDFAAPGSPKLVVLIVVDQMRADYLEKLGPTFHDGFKRLMKQGAWFTHAAYPYAKTVTCAGHSTVSTGDFPSTHGMINNAWFDRAAGKMLACTGDATKAIVTYGGAAAGTAGESAWQMKAPSFAEQLRAQSAGSRVVTMSLKARAAISMAGHSADSVTWLDGTNWVTSTAFSDSPRPELEAYVRSHPIERDFGKPLVVQRDGYGTGSSMSNRRDYVTATDGRALVLPFLRVASYDEWEASAFSDAYLEKLAEVEIEKLQLGSESGTDFLAISFSALDIAGHAKGPNSPQVDSVLDYLDATLGDLLDVLDHRVGKGKYVVALTGDHGVAPIPEKAVAQGIDAGRADAGDLTARVTSALSAFGGGEHPVAAFTDGDLYFAAGAWEKIRGDAKALDAVFATIRGVAGVAEVFRVDQLGELAAKNPLAKAALLSEFLGRGGDLVVLTKPYWFFDHRDKSGAWGAGTTHGSPYPYDQQVPILLMGPGIRAGKYSDAVTPADIAPTLAKLTGVTIARTDGQPLTAALSKESPR